MLRCPEIPPYTGCIPRRHGSNTSLFNDRTARISAPNITDRIVRPEKSRFEYVLKIVEFADSFLFKSKRLIYLIFDRLIYQNYDDTTSDM